MAWLSWILLFMIEILILLALFGQKFSNFRELGFGYKGPFLILARVGQVVYKVQLPPSSQYHPVFHV